MTEIAKILRSEVAELDGREVIVFVAKTAAGEEVKVAFPSEGLRDVFSDAARKITAYRAQNGRQEHGQWFSTLAISPQSYDVGTLPTTDGEKVALTIDRNRPSEQTLAIEPGHARELGSQLIEEAGRTSAAAPSRN